MTIARLEWFSKKLATGRKVWGGLTKPLAAWRKPGVKGQQSDVLISGFTLHMWPMVLRTLHHWLDKTHPSSLTKFKGLTALSFAVRLLILSTCKELQPMEFETTFGDTVIKQNIDFKNRPPHFHGCSSKLVLRKEAHHITSPFSHSHHEITTWGDLGALHHDQWSKITPSAQKSPSSPTKNHKQHLPS